MAKRTVQRNSLVNFQNLPSLLEAANACLASRKKNGLFFQVNFLLTDAVTSTDFDRSLNPLLAFDGLCRSSQISSGRCSAATLTTLRWQRKDSLFFWHWLRSKELIQVRKSSLQLCICLGHFQCTLFSYYRQKKALVSAMLTECFTSHILNFAFNKCSTDYWG